MRQWLRSSGRYPVALALICFGIFTSALCFFVLRSLETQKVRAQFRHAAGARMDELELDLDMAVDKVQDLGAFCASRKHLSRSSFDLFASQALRGHETIQALEWAPLVPLARRAALEHTARAEGLQGYRIRDRVDGNLVSAGERPSYVPVLYIYPQAGNEIAVGYDDLALNSVRREVLQHAQATGDLSASARLVLAQETLPSEFGVLLVQPVYYGISPGTAQVNETEHPILGFVEGVLRIGVIMRRHGESSGVRLTIVDLSAASGPQQLYTPPLASGAPISPFSQYRTITIGGRHWRIIASPLRGAFAVSNRRAYVGSALCLLFTLVVAALMYEILGRNQRIEHQVAERGRQLSDTLAALENVHRGLEESEARYRRLVEDSPCAILVERRGKVVLANRTAVEMFGIDPCHELEGQSMCDFVAPESAELAGRLCAQLSEREMRIGPHELRVKRQDGRLQDVQLAASSFTQNGSHTIQIVLTDITQRKLDEDMRARLFTAIEQLRECVVITDSQARIVYVNPAFERITGYSREEAIGKTPRLLNSGRQSSKFYAQMWEVLKRGEAWSGRFVNRAKDGHLFTEEAAISPVVNGSGELINYVAVKRDVSRELELQEQLLQAQKMEAIGRLAGGVAHDFNNMLMVIISYADLLLESMPEGDPAREQVTEILNAAHRSCALTRQLLAFSRKQPLAPRVIDCNVIVSDTSRMIRRLISENFELRCDLDRDLWPVKVDPDQLAQVIVNLCVNSRDAMPNGGTIVLTTRNDVERECVEISVSDSGCGIPLENQRKIFEPFFTTKETGKGTGLGLAAVYGLVQQSGGSVRVESQPGHGATFFVALPRCVQADDAVEPHTAKAPSGDQRIVLIVEDEDSLRQCMLQALRAQGYEVLAAADGSQALAILARTAGIGVVVCDLLMPHMGGRELARLAVQQYPELRFIFMSGHPGQDHQDVEAAGQTVFLPKPFDVKALLAAIAELQPSPCSQSAGGRDAQAESSPV